MDEHSGHDEHEGSTTEARCPRCGCPVTVEAGDDDSIFGRDVIYVIIVTFIGGAVAQLVGNAWGGMVIGIMLLVAFVYYCVSRRQRSSGP